MFRILCDPSSGSTELCLTEITRSGSQIFCRVLWQRHFESVVCVRYMQPEKERQLWQQRLQPHVLNNRKKTVTYSIYVDILV